MKTPAIPLLLLLIAAAPATKPTTEPTGYPAMQRKLAELLAQIADLKSSNKKLADENASLASQVKKLQPPEPASKDVPFGVGWEGPIGKARVLRRTLSDAAILEIHDPAHPGADLGVVWVRGIDAIDIADGMEIEIADRIRITKVIQDNYYTSKYYLSAEVVK